MNTLQVVTDSNNQGVALLVMGEADKAVRYFKEALAILKQAVFHPNAIISVQDAFLADSRKASEGSTMGSSRDALVSYGKESNIELSSQTDRHKTAELDRRRQITVPVPGLHDRDSFIYNHALTCPCDIAREDLEFYIHVHSAVVIFNMALAHHRKGKTHRLPSLLRKAICLYDMSLALLENGPSKGTGLLVKVACLNNKAQINHAHGEYTEARVSLDQLSRIILANGNSGALILDESDVEGFLLNLLLLNPPQVAQAA